MTAVATRKTGSNSRQKFKPSWPHRLIALVFVVVAVGSLMLHEQSRRIEASVAAWVIENVVGIGTSQLPEGTALTVGTGTQHIFTLDITFACSVTLLIAPLLFIAAAVLYSGRGTLARTAIAAIAGSLALVAVNTLRIILIVLMTRSGGMAGFGWAHTVYGSLIVLVGLAVVGTIFIKVVTSGRSGGRSS